MLTSSVQPSEGSLVVILLQLTSDVAGDLIIPSISMSQPAWSAYSRCAVADKAESVTENRNRYRDILKTDTDTGI